MQNTEQFCEACKLHLDVQNKCSMTGYVFPINLYCSVLCDYQMWYTDLALV